MVLMPISSMTSTDCYVLGVQDIAIVTDYSGAKRERTMDWGGRGGGDSKINAILQYCNLISVPLLDEVSVSFMSVNN